ncbi:hypothetical protein NQ315_006089 [Exocentrus adspersus]|uniref:Uncharacterized protein n=1 Tax=Exocentrus adspersus TaxID=1586481 RepID=A0AAV8VE59_9CUCU|nr:hypothetical protein NQ315_006089 [Exocentrus adspersus]
MYGRYKKYTYKEKIYFSLQGSRVTLCKFNAVARVSLNGSITLPLSHVKPQTQTALGNKMQFMRMRQIVALIDVLPIKVLLCILHSEEMIILTWKYLSVSTKHLCIMLNKENASSYVT